MHTRSQTLPPHPAQQFFARMCEFHGVSTRREALWGLLLQACLTGVAMFLGFEMGIPVVPEVLLLTCMAGGTSLFVRRARAAGLSGATAFMGVLATHGLTFFTEVPRSGPFQGPDLLVAGLRLGLGCALLLVMLWPDSADRVPEMAELLED